MGLFGKKKGFDAPRPMGDMPEGMMPSSSPVDAVNSMKQQGMSNNQIIQELQRQGYNPQQIFDAINMSEPTNISAGPINMSGFEQPQMPSMPEQGMGMQAAPSYDSGREKIEEMAEAIIDEKWEELVKSINKIIEWKEKIEGDINRMEQEIKDVKESFNQLHSSIIGKINDYDKNIVNVGTEVKAMEKVFENILPSLTENVGELRRLVKGAKK